MQHNTTLPCPIRLRVEHRVNPMGLSTRTPRLSWNIPVTNRGERQVAFQIKAAHTLASVQSDTPDIWDSGHIESADSHLVPFDNAAGNSDERIWWQVRYRNQNGDVSAWSEPAFWETGLLRSSDWCARWLKLYRERPDVGGRILPPCPFVRKEFTLSAPVVRARAYATARGVYKLYVNGLAAGEDELAPGWTDYNRRVQYQTYDITALLHEGANAVGAIVGDGWYSGYVGFNGARDHYGREPELLVQLNVDLADGTHLKIGTDGNWKVTTGPVIYSDMLAGERYDAREELTGWNEPGYDDSGWKGAFVHWRPVASSPLVGQPDLPVCVTEELRPKSIQQLEGGKYIVDMGQNMVGRARLRVSGPRDTVVRMRFAEILEPDGSLYVHNLRGAAQTDEYVLRGDRVEEYEPLFTFHGFRYIEVDGYPGTLTADSITGRVLESRTEPIGTIETGHPMVNQLIDNIVWGQRGNFVSVPTDCPQRDERMGWMGDAQVFARTAAYNRDVAGFFTKWLADVRDGQTTLGSFPNVAPLLVMDGDGAPAWGDAGVIVPWTMYVMYGDKQLLETSYESMVKWIAYIEEGNPDLIWRERCSYNFSDWLSIEANTPADVLATAYFAYDCKLVSKAAAILGKDDDARRYDTLFQRVRAAFNREFVSPDGVITGQTQTCYLLALHMDLLSDEHRRLAARYLVEDIESRDYHLSTGFIGVGYLCPILTQIGRADVAYRLLLNDTFPSWGYSIKHGATTIWERWDGWTDHKGFQDPSMNSFNHYSLGSVGEWMYRYMAGIDVNADGAGFQTFILNPYPDERVGGVRASYLSPYGTIESEWTLHDLALTWKIAVPGNTVATVCVPAARVEDVLVDGKAALDSDGLRFLRQEDDRAVFTAQPGAYDIRSTVPPSREDSAVRESVEDITTARA